MFGTKLCLGTVLVVSLTGLVQADESAAKSRVGSIIELVLEQHFDPPAAQQMVLAGAKALYRASNKRPPQELVREVSQLSTVQQFEAFLDALYVKFGDLKKPEAICVSGIVAMLPGKSVLINESADKVQQQLAANRYVGIGIALGTDDKKRPVITKVIYDGPAFHGGITQNDVILEIDGSSTDSKSLREVVEELRGESGSDVKLQLLAASGESRELTITRGRVFIPTVIGDREVSPGQWEFTIESAPEIGYMQLSNVGPSTLHELRRVEEKLREKKLQGIVLDLRHGGGTLHDVVMVADALISDATFGHFQSNDSLKTYRARPGALFEGVPLAVLTSAQMGTDRVFLTAALQDHRGATVVGEPSGGEMYVNRFVSVPGSDDKIRLAVGILQRGDGTPLFRVNGLAPQMVRLQARGGQAKADRKVVVPDHQVLRNFPQAPREYAERAASHSDQVLQRAIEVLGSDQTAGNEVKQDVSG